MKKVFEVRSFIVNYIVLDMEWNQPPHPKRMVRKPVVLVGEVIQIGAAKVDQSLEVVDTFKAMVAPQFYTKMHKHVTRVTGLTNDDIAAGLPFAEVFEDFAKWCGEDCVILTWGPDDIPMLRTNMMLYEIDCALPPCYDLQVIYDGQIAHENRQHSLTAVMDALNEPALDAHDALNDAINTAKVCRHLDMKKGLDEYPTPSRNGHERKGVAYANKEEAIIALREVFCPLCGAPMTLTAIKEQDSRHSAGLGRCENGHELSVVFRFVKWADRLYTATRSFVEITPDEGHEPPQKKRRRRRRKKTTTEQTNKTEQ